MSKNHRVFTSEDKEKARNMDIMEIGEQHGLSFAKDGAKWYHCNEHDSMIIDAKNNSFHWNSQNIHGSGGISFATEVLDYKFQDAMKMLVDGKYNEHDGSNLKENKNTESLKYSINDEKQPNKVKSYLEKERGLHPNLVDWGIKTGVIGQDERNNATFKWLDNDNNIVGVDKRGTSTNKFQQIVQGSKENYGFHIDVLQNKNKPIENFVITESPIDALSYYEAHKGIEQTRVASMSGVKENVLIGHLNEVYKHNRNNFPNDDINVNLTFAVDSDEAGKQFISNFLEKYEYKGEINIDLPQDTKDWNEQLKKDKAITNGEITYEKPQSTNQASKVIDNDKDSEMER